MSNSSGCSFAPTSMFSFKDFSLLDLQEALIDDAEFYSLTVWTKN